MSEHPNAVTESSPTLEYRKPSRLNMISWLTLAGFHYLGSAISVCATIVIEMRGEGDREAIALLPFALIINAGLLLVPASLICLALLGAGYWFRRSVPRGSKWKAFLIGGVIACGALLIDDFILGENFSDDHTLLMFLFYAGSLVALPLVIYLLLSRPRSAAVE